MLPSELVSQVIVRKTATADLIEGGIPGAVDIITRKPLQFSKQVTVEGAIGTVYSDLAEKWDPQANVLIGWKNDAGNVGVLGQAFYEKRHLRRDGQEILGYGTIAPGSALAIAKPDLANVAYPTLIGSALFEQERTRKGGLLNVQVKATNELEIDLEGFYSKLEASNYNRNWMMWGSHIIGNNLIPSSYTVRNGTLTSAVWPNIPGQQYAIVDQILRPGAFAETSYFNFDAKWRAASNLTFLGQVGTTTGKGETPKQDVFEGDVLNTGASYTFHGVGSPVDVAFPSGHPSVFTGTTLDWIFGASPAKTKDDENYAKLDGEWGAPSGGMMNAVKFGVRYAEHKRETEQVAQGPNFATDPFNPANLPAWNGQTYPSNFGSRLGGGDFPRTPWMLDPGILEAWGDLHSNRDPVTRDFWPGEFSLKEKVWAGYIMANFDGPGWAGNAGVRYVQTKEDVTVNVAIPGAICDVFAACPQVPGAITTSAFGSYYKNLVSNTYNDWLPSANLRFDLAKDVVGRLAAARTMARPDYSALGGSITADDTTHTGNGGNPNLKPIRSTNLDASVEWYYAPRSLVSGALYYLDLTNYVAFGTYQTPLFDIRNNRFAIYTISAPTNSKGKVSGAELNWQAPIWGGFGGQANYTYANAKEKKSCAANDTGCLAATDDLVGASKNVYNLMAYYEDAKFGARINYTYRSAYFVGLDRSTPQYQDDTGTLSASLSYQIDKRFSIHFDGLNLNDPVLKMYGANKDQPRAFYANGRQYYVTLRMKL
jgi:iron complex outermembrane receptor protein